jgi:hypothetical protein
MLAHHHLYLHDPISRDKFTAYDSYTYFANNGKFRSILDKLFTSFPSEHCEKKNTQKNTTTITKPAQDQDSITPQLAKQILHYGHKGINTKRRRLFETALNDGWGVQGDGCSSTMPINNLDETSRLLAEILQNDIS